MSRKSSASPEFLVALAVLLALTHALMAITATKEKSVTADEIAHLVAGDTYNRRGDFRFQPENGNLPQRWAALPLTVAAGPVPDASVTWQRADVWRYGHTYFFGQGLSTDAMLMAGRAMIALFSAGLGLVIFFWSRALFGWRGAFISLALYSFSPSFLAHGALATSDLVMSFFLVASVGSFWRHLERPGPLWASVSAVAFGLAFVAKFSAVLLLPMLGLCALGWLAGTAQTEGFRRPLLRLVRSVALHLVVAWALIWTFYGWRFSAFAPDAAAGAVFYRGDWAWILDDIGWPQQPFLFARQVRLLPEAFLYGFAFVVQFSKERAAFFGGEYGTTGWVTFFPFAFLVKSTLPFLLLLAGGAISGGLAIGRQRTREGLAAVARRLRPLTPLAALFAVYWITSLTSHLNIGHRHILPTYPVLFIAAGWLGRWLEVRRPLALVCITGALVWHAAESIRARPHYLAYFNQLVGGSANGWRHLVDSSLDWGQELPGLKHWLDANARSERVFLSYFGTGDPVYEGIYATALPTLPEVGAPRPWRPLTPGVYAISATMLQHVYSPIRGDWTLEREKEFQQLRAIEPVLLAYQDDPRRRVELLRDAPAANWAASWKRYEELRFARLCHYLRVRRPESVIGHAIFIFRLDATELRAALGGSLKDWQGALEQAVNGPAVTVPVKAPEAADRSR
ncbi:MAG: glycosyltransferase family 39 protein [Verrucomicrobiota bacterium]